VVFSENPGLPMRKRSFEHQTEPAVTTTAGALTASLPDDMGT